MIKYSEEDLRDVFQEIFTNLNLSLPLPLRAVSGSEMLQCSPQTLNSSIPLASTTTTLSHLSEIKKQKPQVNSSVEHSEEAAFHPGVLQAAQTPRAHRNQGLKLHQSLLLQLPAAFYSDGKGATMVGKNIML